MFCNLWYLGWGKIVHPGHAHTVLQQAKQTIVSYQDCANKLNSAPGTPGDAITKNMICAKNSKGSSSCQGDSGGPFVCQENGKWLLTGVVSWGSPR